MLLARSRFASAIRWILSAWTFLAVCFEAFAEEQGTAYWGSFGDGAVRVECALFQGADASYLIGYDDQSEAAYISTEFSWESDSSFVFEAQKLTSSQSETTRGNGTLGPIQAAASPSSVLTGEIGGDADTLSFDAYASTQARFFRLELLGLLEAQLFVVDAADEGYCYVLYLDEEEKAYGGTAIVEDSEALFLMPDGSEFFFSLGSELGDVAGSYALADGVSGDLRQSSVDTSSETPATRVERVWFSDRKAAGYGAEAMHFILEGDGSALVTATCGLEVTDWDGDSFDIGAVFGVVYQMNSDDEYIELVRSAPFARLKSEDGDALQFAGRATLTLPEGTYLIQLSGIQGVDARFSIEAGLSYAGQISLVNASMLYRVGSDRDDRTLGFELSGSNSAKALLRNVGPSLTRFSIYAPSANPFMTVVQPNAAIWKNDDWWVAPSPSQLIEQADAFGAFQLNAQSKDSALALHLAPGVYELSPQPMGQSGFEMVEVYFE